MKLFNVSLLVLSKMVLLIIGTTHYSIFSQVIDAYEHHKNQDAFYQMARVYHTQKGKMTCGFLDEEIQRIEALSEEQLRQELYNNQKVLEENLSIASSDEQKKEVERINQKLNDLSKARKPKKFLKNALQKICRATRIVTQKSSQAFSLVNSAALNTLLSPLGSLYHFSKGVFSARSHESVSLENNFLYDLMGPKGRLSSYVLSQVAYEVPNFLLLGGSLVYSGITISKLIDFISTKKCLEKREGDEEREAFCLAHQEIKKNFRSLNTKSFKLGKKIQRWIDQKKMNRSAPRFCRFRKEKQVRRASKAIERLKTFGHPFEGVIDWQIILPIHKNDCTKILAYSKEEFLDYAIDDIEGIEVIRLKAHSYPDQFYFTESEMNSLDKREGICHDQLRNHLHSKAFNKNESSRELFKSMLTPQVLGQPEIEEVVIENENLIQTANDVRDLKNIVLSIGLDEASLNKARVLDARSKLLMKKIKKFFKKLNRKKRFHSCMKFLKRYDDLKLNQYIEAYKEIVEIHQNPIMKSYREMDVVDKFFKKRRVKMKWELIKSNTIQKILETLKRDDVANLVILSHGLESGHLVDSLRQELPKIGLKSFKPHLMSLNFYSCHSKNLIELYDLRDHFKGAHSVHKVRYLTHVRENDFLDKNAFAPLSAFGHFMTQLDADLWNSLRGSQLVQERLKGQIQKSFEQETKMCSLDLSDIEVEKGSYAIELNGHLAGVLSSDSDALMNFPCDWINDEDTQKANRLKISNVIATGGSVIRNLKSFVVTIEDKNIHSSKASIALNSMVIIKF